MDHARAVVGFAIALVPYHALIRLLSSLNAESNALRAVFQPFQARPFAFSMNCRIPFGRREGHSQCEQVLPTAIDIDC